MHSLSLDFQQQGQKGHAEGEISNSCKVDLTRKLNNSISPGKPLEMKISSVKICADTPLVIKTLSADDDCDSSPSHANMSGVISANSTPYPVSGKVFQKY